MRKLICPMNVDFASWEWREGAMVGVDRMTEALINGYKEAYGCKAEDATTKHINGSVGERVIAKILNIYWKGRGEVKGHDFDFGQPYEVRSTGYRDGKLLLHKKDDDDRLFFLVVGHYLHWTVAGYIRGRDGKKPEYWDTNMPTPCFAVPQSKLLKQFPPPKE